MTIGLHVSAMAFHRIWDRSDVLQRMLHAHATEPQTVVGSTTGMDHLQ